jgi:hypothetical protein
LESKVAYGIVIAAVAALLAGLAMSYGQAAKTSAGESPPPPSKVQASEYGFSNLKADLLYIKRKLARYDRYNQTINYSGVESRLFKHVQGILDPEACRDIVSLSLVSESPLQGFSVKSDCLSPRERGAALDVRFLGGWAVLHDHRSGLQMDVPILASAQREWDSGERRYKRGEPQGSDS